MRKNVAGQVIGAQLVSASDGSAFTGSVTVAVTGDAGTQATGSVGSGACTHEGGGYHTYAPAQAETNYDIIAFTFSGTGAVPVTVQVFTVNAKLTATAIANMEVVYATDFATNYSTANDQWSVSASAVASVAGAVGSVTGNVGGNVAGSVGSVTGNVGGNVTGSIGSLATQAKADVNAEVDTALADYDAPTNTEMVAAFTEIKGATWATTDTLEAIRDRGDAAWVTATGFSTLDAAGIRTAVGLASANLDTQLAALPTATENADGLLDLTDGVETDVTPRQALRAISSILVGIISGAGTGTEVFKGVGQASGGTTRVTVTVDSSGNRSALTLNL